MHSNQEYKLLTLAKISILLTENSIQKWIIWGLRNPDPHHTLPMYFMFKKCFISENYIRVKMEIYNAKSLDTFSSEVSTKWKRSKKMEALLFEQALCMWLLGYTKSKLSYELALVGFYTTIF